MLGISERKKKSADISESQTELHISHSLGFTDDVSALVCDNQYGGQEHLDAPPRELLLAQTEDYVEYSRHGAVLKGLEKAVARSKYEEDVLINNHTVRRADCSKCVANFCTF